MPIGWLGRIARWLGIIDSKFPIKKRNTLMHLAVVDQQLEMADESGFDGKLFVVLTAEFDFGLIGPIWRLGVGEHVGFFFDPRQLLAQQRPVLFR